MSITIRCPQCNKPLAVPDALLGKTVRCGGCQATFPASTPAPLQAITPEALPLPAAVPLEPAPAPARLMPAPVRRAASGPVKPFSFKAAVQNDPENLLKGAFECRVTEEGLELKQAKRAALLVPAGSRTEYLGGSRFSVEVEERTVVFAIAEWSLFHQSLARDLCGFLQDGEPAPEREDYVIPPNLYVLAFLPIGIPIITLGGALWGGLGGGLVAACLGIIRQEKLSMGLRVLLCLLLTAAGYGILGTVFWMQVANKRG